MLEAIHEVLPPALPDEKPAEAAMKIAVVGRPNSGKSTFINTLLETDRMIVSEIPGTTRDSVDVRFELDGLEFMAIDNARRLIEGEGQGVLDIGCGAGAAVLCLGQRVPGLALAGLELQAGARGRAEALLRRGLAACPADAPAERFELLLPLALARNASAPEEAASLYDEALRLPLAEPDPPPDPSRDRALPESDAEGTVPGQTQQVS